MKLRHAGITLSLGTLFGPATPTADTLVFAVEQGSSLKKTFDTSIGMELDEVRMTIGEQELPGEIEAFAVSYQREESYVVVDEYRAVEGGRPLELVRRFDALDRHEKEHREAPGSEVVDKDESTESELVGHAVVFVWSDESGAYDVKWAGEGADDDLLEGLDEDMDLRAFLPPEPVSPDDTWELSGKAVLEAMPPGGRLGFPREDEEDQFDFEGAFEGSAEARYTETREEDGVRLAVIVVELEGSIEAPTKEVDGVTQDLAFALDLEYELLWDLGEGRADSLEVTGGLGACLTITREVEVQGRSLPLVIELVLSGPVEMSGVFERE